MGKALIPSAKVYGCSAVQNAIRKIRSTIMEKSAASLRIFPTVSQFAYCKHFTSGTFFTTKRFTDNLAPISAKKTDFELLGRAVFSVAILPSGNSASSRGGARRHQPG